MPNKCVKCGAPTRWYDEKCPRCGTRREAVPPTTPIALPDFSALPPTSSGRRPASPTAFEPFVFSPLEPAPRENAETLPQKNVETAAKVEPTPRENVETAAKNEPAPRENVETAAKNELAPRENVETAAKVEPAPRENVETAAKNEILVKNRDARLETLGRVADVWRSAFLSTRTSVALSPGKIRRYALWIVFELVVCPPCAVLGAYFLTKALLADRRADYTEAQRDAEKARTTLFVGLGGFAASLCAFMLYVQSQQESVAPSRTPNASLFKR